LGNSI